MFNAFRKGVKNEGNIWPEHLIIFRDGVSEGELHSVVDQEFAQVKGNCQLSEQLHCDSHLT